MLTPTRWIGLGYGFGVEQLIRWRFCCLHEAAACRRITIFWVHSDQTAFYQDILYNRKIFTLLKYKIYYRWEEESDVFTANVRNEKPGIARPKTENNNWKHRVGINLTITNIRGWASFIPSPKHSVLLSPQYFSNGYMLSSGLYLCYITPS